MRPRGKKYLFILSAILLLTLFTLKFYNVILTRAYPIFIKIEHAVNSDKYQYYLSEDSKHFTVKYNKDDYKHVSDILDIAEHAYNHLADFLDYKNIGHTEIIVYDNMAELNKAIDVPVYKKTIGAYSKGRILILSPVYWDCKSDQGVVLHELAHLVVDRIGKGNYPVWFTEGIALYAEYKLLGNEWQHTISMDQINYTIDDLTYNFALLDDYKAYRKSFLIVKALADKYGMDKVVHVLELAGTGKCFDDCIFEVIGTNLSQIENIL